MQENKEMFSANMV